eukprot:12826845-Alexandrium_andersonii.AAC.1
MLRRALQEEHQRHLVIHVARHLKPPLRILEVPLSDHAPPQAMELFYREWQRGQIIVARKRLVPNISPFH